MKYKICVYAICKNEIQFAERWYNSMCEADCVYVLDTGSTDGTEEKLTSLGAHVLQRKIVPWRFDVARNLSMDMLPDDTDICVCTDLDEVFDSGWRQKLEDAWKPDATLLNYKYVWSFDDNGNEDIIFYAQKIHSRHGFKWIYPVHEVLEYVGKNKENSLFASNITLKHYPDSKKSRSDYLALLELSVKEYPHNDRNMHYLGREYMFAGMWDKSINVLKTHLSLPTAVWKSERCASMRYIAECYIQKNDTRSAMEWLFRAIAEAPYLREPYIESAYVCMNDKDWNGVVFFCEKALEIKKREISYISSGSVWGALPYDLLSLGYFYTERYSKALKYVKIAAELAPNDDRIQQNLNIISEKMILHNN